MNLPTSSSTGRAFFLHVDAVLAAVGGHLCSAVFMARQHQGTKGFTWAKCRMNAMLDPVHC